MNTVLDTIPPLHKLRAFASELGWNGLRMCQKELDKDTIVTWYTTTDSKFYLQFNEHPIGQRQTYGAAVCAFRYRVWVGFYLFSLDDRESKERLLPLLSRRLLRDPHQRRIFKQRFPEFCSLYRRWPPYYPEAPAHSLQKKSGNP